VRPAPSWSIAGAYFESCNCEAICPCRAIDGVLGGRSTYGICFGVLSWHIEEGRAGEIALDGLAVALVLRYDDDEPGSPWRFRLHVDARGSGQQREALAAIMLGRYGGDHVLELPWVRKPSELLDVVASPIELRRGPKGHELRVGTAIALTATRAVETEHAVTCVIPGHHQPGSEYYADELVVRDGPFEWELAGNCAYASRFAYSSDGSRHA
jgi:hypothetical protein